jgi:hypothetical protein
MIFKTKPIQEFPKTDEIQDPAVKNFGRDLAETITKTIRNIYDDIRNLENAEVVSVLPTASSANRGKMFILSGASDGLYICVDTGGSGFVFKQITIT